MKYLSLLVPVFLCVFISGSGVQAQGISNDKQVSFGGTIGLRNGEVITVIEFLSPLKTSTIQGIFEGSQVELYASQLSEIWLLDEEYTYDTHTLSAPNSDSGSIQVINREGDSFIIRDATFIGDARFPGLSGIRYSFYNPITLEVCESMVSVPDVAYIFIGEDVGHIRHCQNCDRFFPECYIYCPYDAYELEWFTPDWME